MSKYQSFIFENYDFDEVSKLLRLNYSLDNKIFFQERYKFDFDFVEYDPKLLARLFENLFLLAGVSYYKTYLPPQIDIKEIALTEAQARFYTKTYQKGLGEFFFVNGLDPKTEIIFPYSNNRGTRTQLDVDSEGMIIGIGGGKDSLVSTELMRSLSPKPSTWSVGHRSQLTPLVERIGSKHYWVERVIDRALLEHNLTGALNGHVPISAILASVGVVVAVLSGQRDVVVSNEQSASEPNLVYEGVAINHQYSKSLEFEQDFQQLLLDELKTNIRYYSLLRPFSEVYIASLFATYAFSKYKDVFSSCNLAFIQSQTAMSWCGHCPKCAFTFLALSPFIERKELEKLWSGKNLLLDPKLRLTYEQLLGITGHKPLECVGEVKESRKAMQLTQPTYPELSDYTFEMPTGYDYQQWGDHNMPQEVYNKLKEKING